MRQEENLWGESRLTMEHSIELTIESLSTYGSLYKHWAIAFSGGKDSTATATLTASLIATKQVPQPESLTVIYSDTRDEVRADIAIAQVLAEGIIQPLLEEIA